MKRKILVLLLLLPACLVQAELAPDDIVVLGLFEDAAMLSIEGKQQLLKKGERNDAGVTLVEANSDEAVVELNGKKMILNLSDRISARFIEAKVKIVSIALNDNQQYITTAVINGVPVEVLVDTGATMIAINSETAKNLGISTADGKKVEAATASGMVASTLVVLREVSVGDIKLNNVKALIVEGSFPKKVLLGMTFLQQVEITESAGLMVLKSSL
jgi:aspartyl protease family protein|tara:strand:+ start:226 stop:873 length:648 start_codon:yes stop_codon:yes gene_type:complete